MSALTQVSNSTGMAMSTSGLGSVVSGVPVPATPQGRADFSAFGGMHDNFLPASSGGSGSTPRQASYLANILLPRS